MNILLIHQYFLGDRDPGGSRFNQFVKYWTAAGHRVTVVAGNVNYATGRKDAKYGRRLIMKESHSDKLTVYRCYVSDAYNKSFLGRMWGYISFTLSSLLACLFRVGRHDVMIVTSPPLFVGITGIIFSWLRNIPMIFEVRDLWPESAIDAGVLKNKWLIRAAYRVERLCYKRAAKINVLTPAFREKLILDKGVDPQKICYVPNGADLDLFEPGEKNNWVRERYGLVGKFVVTYMGAHGVANDLRSLLRVAELCQDEPDIVFMLVGDGMEKAKLMRIAAEKGLRNVIFVPPQPKEDVAHFCRASDVCTAVLKKADTFKTVYPNKVFDYMSCAKPILIGIDGVARQLVEESGSGFYVDPDNPYEFKARILQLYRDPELAARLGDNGYRYVAAHFSRQTLAGRYESELRDTAHRARSPVRGLSV